MLGRIEPAGGSPVSARGAAAGLGSAGVRWTLSGLAAIAVLVALGFATQVYVFGTASPASISTSAETLNANVPISADLSARASGVGTSVQAVRLYRSDAGSPGSQAREQVVPVRLDPTPDGGLRVTAPDGGSVLRPDGAYRMDVVATVPSPFVPVPRFTEVTRSYRFTTVAGPTLETMPAEVRPRWNEPIALRWSLPMQQVTVTTQPRVPAAAILDPADPTRVLVRLGDEAGPPAGVSRVDVTVSAARSVSGVDLQRPAAFTVMLPERPRVVAAPSSPVVLKRGETVTFETAVPVVDARVEAADGTPITTRIEGAKILASLAEYRQGLDTTLRLTAATSREGAPLQEPALAVVRTPAPLVVAAVSPDGEGALVDTLSRPMVQFAQPVADRAAAEKALVLDPPVEGRWQWSGLDRVEFVPATRLTPLTDFTLTVRGGPDGVRAAGGGYLESDRVSTFSTPSNKRLDVSLSRQVMTLFEDGKPRETILVATGVKGAETPLGQYAVQYKMPIARFRGVNPSGLAYDIPDVKWVLAFFEDYTIHGAYWRTQFGTPGSNGCISMTDADAKRVYDWADVGTIVNVRA